MVLVKMLMEMSPPIVSVTTGFSGYKFPEKDRRAHQPQDYC